MYHGDIRLGDTHDFKFTTVNTSGVPTTLAGSPVISAYPANSTTEVTAGITLTVDFDSRTGLNNVRVVATGGNGYATATDYALVITTGTVGTSVVGYTVATFSIENRSALMPTTVALTLDVSATGEAGVDWANVGGKTTVNALTNTSIITTQKVDVDTIKTNPVVNGGTITFPTNATVASTTNITAATGVDTTKIGGTTQTTGVDVAGKAASLTFTVANQIDANVLDWKSAAAPAMTGDAFARLGVPVGASISADIAEIEGETDAIQAKTDQLTFTAANKVDANTLTIANGAIAAATFAASAIDAAALATDAGQEIADRILARNVSGGSDAGRTVKQALHLLRNKVSIAAGTMTVTDTDDTTASWTAAVTTAAGNPIDSVDPA